MELSLLVVDDHNMFRDGIIEYLKNSDIKGNIEGVKEASQAFDLLSEKSYDIVIMDISLPDMLGLDACLKILKKFAGVKVIMLSMYEDVAYIEQALNIGAHGYLLKRCAAEELVKALKMVVAGERYYSPAIASIVVDYIRDGGEKKSVFKSLTNREREILTLFGKGMSSREIAAICQISPKTVDNHKDNIMRKLSIHSKAQLIHYAIKNGLC